MSDEDAARLRSLEAELATLRAEIDRGHEREALLHAQKMDSLARLAGGLAHDFNNLLTPILAYANMGLMQLRIGEPLHEELDEIRQAADRATGLIRQLLTFSRKQPMQLHPVAPNRLIEGLVRMLRRLAGDCVDVELELAADLGNVLADPSRICLLYTSPSPRDRTRSRMPSSA